jgi:hypothetical protein
MMERQAFVVFTPLTIFLPISFLCPALCTVRLAGDVAFSAVACASAKNRCLLFFLLLPAKNSRTVVTSMVRVSDAITDIAFFF